MRILKYSVIFLVVLFVIYAATWLIALSSIAKGINDKYAGQNISTRLIGADDQNFIKFSHVSPTGFPFKFAVKIIGWFEDNKISTLECLSPIILGYDLFKQSVFIKYTGEAITRYKPIQSGFGSKIKSDDYSVLIKLPFSIKLLQLLRSNKDLFEVINFIKNIQLQSKKITVSDLVDNEVLYDKDFESVKLSSTNRKYYTDFDDFLQNVPNRLDIYYSTKINKTPFNRQPAPPNLLFGILSPFAFSAEINLYAKTNESNFNDISKDLEIGVVNSKISNDVNYLTTNILYKGFITSQGVSFSFKTDNNLEVEEGFVDKYSTILKDFISYLPNTPDTIDIKDKIDYIINNKDQLELVKALEKRKYSINLDLNFNMNSKKSKINAIIKNFNIVSGKTGIYVRNSTTFDHIDKWNITGHILINNYTKLVDLIGSDFYKLGKYQSFPDSLRKIYIETDKDFLKIISDHPKSTSEDISFEYDLDSTKIMSSKVGSTEVGKIPVLYYLNLYKNAAGKLQPEDNLRDKIKELIPNLDNAPDILQKFIN